MPRKCEFAEDGRGRLVCKTCGLGVTVVGSGSPEAVCGHPRTLRVVHGESGPAGPGTHLKRLLSHLGIVAGSGCKCGERAAEMDKMGPDWCEKHLSTVVDWLEEEAKTRGFSFFTRFAARMLVKKAIRLARKDSSATRPSLPPER